MTDGSDDWITPDAPAASAGQPAAPAASVSASAPVASDDIGGDRPLTIRPASISAPATPPSAPSPTSDASGVDDWAVPSSASPEAGGVLSNSSDDGWLSGAAKGTATGVIRGLASGPGFVSDTGNFADLIMAGAESKITGNSLADTLASIKAQKAAQQASDAAPADQGVLGKVASGLHWLAGAADPRNLLPTGDQVAAPVLAETGDYQPTTMLGRAAQAGVSTIVGGAGPAAGAKVGAFSDILAAAGRMAPKTFAAGALGDAVSEETGNPLYGAAAGMAAPGLLDLAARYGQRLPSAPGSYFQGLNDDRIGRQLYGMAQNPTAVRDVVAPTDLSANPSSVTVPGFQPTTGQITGDLGLLNAENRMRVANNLPLNQRAGEQNSAAHAALGSVAAGGDEMRPSAVLQQNLDAVDDATQKAQASITSGAQQLAASLGSGETADNLGTTIRSKVEATRQQAQQLRNNLYAAVDPDGVVGTTSAPVSQVKRSILKGVDPFAEPLSDDEKRIYSLVDKMPADMPYRSMAAFDQNLNSALPNATRASKARLQQLKGAVMATLDGTADGVARREAGEVATGTRSASDTVTTRLQQAMPLSNAPAAGSSVFTPSGRQIGVRYGVADAGDLIASHRPDMTANPDFPANLQPRDRSRAASDAQIADIASNLQPGRLGASASAAEGAPIVGPDGVVESGNGRVLAIQRAHAAGGPQAQAYRDFLASHGFDASGMKAPVLVRQRTTDLSPEDRVRFAQEANASPVLAQSATERAATDAGRLRDGTLSQYVPGEVNSAANRPFVRSFLNDVADKGEQGSFAAGDGSLSLDGSRRLQNALVHAGYGDSKLVSSLAETGDPDIAAFGGVMADQAGRMAQLRRGIASGDIHPEADISAPVLEAGRVVQRARAGNMRLADAVAQRDAFDPISDGAHTILKAGYGANLTGRLSRTRLGEYLNDAGGEAMMQSAQNRLFGEPLTADQILQGAQARHARYAGSSDPIANGLGSSGASAGAAGQEGRRPDAGSRGAGGTGPGEQGRDVTGAAAPLASDPAIAARLRTAKDAHIDYERRFVDGPVSKAIETNGFAGQFTRDASSVPALAIRKGAEGYSTAKAYLRDSNNDPAVLEAMTDHALAPLRSSLTPQGTVNPEAYAKWQRDYGPALRALNEADPGFASRYDGAAKATDLMTRAGAMREQALKNYQDNTTAKFLGATDPSEVQDIVGRIINDKGAGVTRMRDLVGKLQGDPDALEGLRRAGAAWMSSHFSNAAKEAATGDQTISTKLPKFAADRKAVLSSLFDDDQVGRINAVAHVLDLKQRSVDALKNKGSSQTSRDQAAALKKIGDSAGHGHTTVLALAGEHAIGMAEHELGTVPGIALGGVGMAGLWALNRLRSGNARADQAAINDALMNPQRFARYTSRVSPEEAERRGAALSASVRRQLIMQPALQRAAAKQDTLQGYARGGAPIVVRSPVRSMVNLAQADRDADGLIRQVAAIKRATSVQSAVAAARVSAGQGRPVGF